MADKKQMSVEEILAACRRMDGPGGSGEEGPTGGAATRPEEPVAEAPVEAEAPAEAPAESAGPDQPSKPSGQMSVAEILAAARAEKEGGGAPPAKTAPAAGKSTAPGQAAAAAGGKKASEMSVAEMLAAARGQKAGGAPAAAKPAPAKAAAAKAPAAAKVAAATKAKPAAAKPAGPKDTASILAAARKQGRPGPISKAEAAERNKVLEQQAAKAKPARPEKAKPEVPPMPAKPAYARPQPAAARTEAAAEPRRNFLTILWATPLAIGFSTIAVTNLLWLLGLARFMFPNILTEPPTMFKVGFPDDYAPGQVEEKFKAQFGVWIVRYEYEGQPQIYALKSVCTHLGCTPNWLEGEQKFKCPCHGSGFYKDGINFEGPAPRPLERYAIRLADDGQLEVDKSRTFNQELGQWNNASSYVTA